MTRSSPTRMRSYTLHLSGPARREQRHPCRQISSSSVPAQFASRLRYMGMAGFAYRLRPLACLPAVRGRQEQRHRHRGRRVGFRAVHPDAGSACLADEHEALQLGLPLGARAEPQQPAHHRTARQGDRRIVVDQRHGLRARPCGGLQPLGGARRQWLGLCRRAALFQADGTQPWRRRGMARHRRAAARAARRHDESAVPRLHRGRKAGRFRGDGRL
jgi:hypothetical protein